MTLPWSKNDRENQSFTENSSDEIARRVVAEIEYGGDPLSGSNKLPVDVKQITSPVANLVTEEDLTASYADLGAEINAEGYTKLGVWVKADVNDSETVTLKVLGLHTTSGDEYDIDGISEKTLWTTGASDFNKYYEFEIGASPIIKLQAKAGTVGATAGDLTIDITKVY
jgi:hypothetical protein